MMGLLSLRTWAIVVAALLLSNAVLYNVGWYRGVLHERAAWVKLRAEIEAANAARVEILTAENRAIAAKLVAAEGAVRVEYVEVIRTVRERASATARCFSPGTTRALNREPTTAELHAANPIRETVHRESTVGPSPQVVERGVEGGTSELAAAEWAAGAQRLYAECRARVESWQQWAAKVTGGAK
jgi:hypothetical protein